MKKRNNTFASPANAPLTFQALQAADFPLKNRNKLTRSQSNTQDQAMGRSSGGGGRSSSNEADFTSAGGVANTRICINNSVPASLFTAMATSTQMPDPGEPLINSSNADLTSSLLPADMGMLRPTAAQRLPQHGLPSGTHIRRRPRSVARPGAGSHGGRHAAGAAANTTPAAATRNSTAAAANNNNAGSSPGGFGSPQQILIAPPSKGLPYGGGAGGDVLARSVYMSPELLSLSPAPASEEMGASSSAAAASTLAQDVKPATRASRDAKPLKYVRRAAPSPAPSRPVRANRRRPPPPNTMTLLKPGSPTEHALAAEGMEEWVDADAIPARGSTASALQRFTTQGSTTTTDAAGDHVVTDVEDESRDGRGSHMAEKRKAEPRLGSGRRLAALANVPAGASQMPSSASETLDFYLKLCAEVGEEPSADWVRALEDAAKDGSGGAAAGGMRKARKEAAVSGDGKATTAAGAAPRRTKSPGAGAKSGMKRSSSSGVGGRTPPAALNTSTFAPGGGQRPPLTRATKASAAAAGPATVEEEVRLYCKAHLYPCLMKIGTIERYRKDLTEAITDFTRACDALPSTEAGAKALLAAHEAAVAAGAGRHGATKSGRGAGSTSPAPAGTALNSDSHRHGGHSSINSPSAASLTVPAGAVGRAHEHVSTLSQIASRMTSDLARLQERATTLLVTLGGFSKEVRRPLGTVVAKEDSSLPSWQMSASSVGSGVEGSKEALNVPQGFVKRLAKEEVKAARLLEMIRSEVETALAAKPCVSVEDSNIFKTPLLYSQTAQPNHPAHLRVRSGESGRALTLSHRSGPHPMHTPRGGAHAGPEVSLSSPSPIGARRQSAHNTNVNTSTALSGRQRTGRGAGKPAPHPSFAPVVRVCVTAPSLSSSFQRTSRRNSAHSDSVRVGATPNTSSREHTSQLSSSGPKPGSGSGSGGHNGTILLVVSCGEPVTGGSGIFSRRASGDSLSSAASQTPTAHQGGAGGRGDRATKATGAARSRSASAGAGKRRGGAASAGSGVKRSGSVKAGGARAATGGSVNSSISAANALPLRSSLRGSAEFGENEIAKAREAASTAIEPSSAGGLTGTASLKSTATFGSARFAVASRGDLDEAKAIWEAVSVLARRSGSSSGFSSPHRKPSDSSTGSHDVPTATAAPSPEKLEKDNRPSTADAFTAALATFDKVTNEAVPPRASSENAPQRGDIAKVLQAVTSDHDTVSTPPPNPGLQSATMVYENSAVPQGVFHDHLSSPFVSQQALPHRPLHGIDSAVIDSLVCSPVDLPVMMIGGGGESPNIAGTSGDDTQDSTLVTVDLSHTLPNRTSAVTPTTTAGTSEPPSAERLRKGRTPVREMRGRSQSILQVAPPNKKSIVAVQLIMAYFRRFRARKQLATRLAQHRKEEESEALAQQRRVSEQRVGQFLWSLVQRQRTRRAVAAHVRELQLQAMANTAAAAEQDAKANSAAAKASAGKALTSRERLLLAKEQREVMRRGDSATARQAASSASTHPISSASESKTSLSPLIATVPELALVDNGISTNMITNYNRDGDSFEVAVLHRLLLAPKALLYAVRAAIDSYPMRPPMAYAKPHEDVRRGEASISPERASQTPDRDDADPLADSMKRAGSITFACASSEQIEKDRRDGVFRVPFSCLRPYVLYYAELAAAQSRASEGVTCVAEPTARAGAKPPRSRVSTPPPQDLPARSSSAPPLLHVPRSVRYDSYVDVDELRHDVPVVKPFPRPFEVWGSSHNLVRRIFSAAAMYAWKLIFSHTPHDDAKQRQLRSRDEQAQRLERVDQRNRMILACYAVHSEREWLREASKDLSFVGQIFNPKRSMDPNDPDLDRHCRETYEFVEDFLYQCFPTVTSLDEVPSFLVGAGLFFVFKEVFQWRADGPDVSAVMKQVPGWALSVDQLTEPRRIVQSQREAFLEGNPNVALFCEGGAHRKGAGRDGWLVANGSGSGGGVSPGASPSSSVAGVLQQQPIDVYLTGFQHFEVSRYEQLCLLHRLARWIYEQRPEAEPKVSNVFSPLSPQQSLEVTTSLMQSSVTALNGGAAAAAAQFLSRRTDDAGKTVSSFGPDDGSDKGVMSAGESSGTSPAHPALKIREGADGKRRFSDTPATDELHLLHTSVSGTSLMHDRLAESTRAGGSGFVNNVLGGGPARHQKQLTQAEKQQDAEEAKKELQVMPVKLVAIPAAALQTVKQQQQQQQGRAAGSTTVTPSRGSGTSADRRSLCDYEHEQFIKQRQHKLSLLVSRYLESAGANSSSSSSKSTRGEKANKRSAVETEKTALAGAEFMMVYPKNFLVDLSEKLTYELLGLRLHLGVCEELDAI